MSDCSFEFFCFFLVKLLLSFVPTIVLDRRCGSPPTPGTWSSYAERNGRIAHAEMQLHAIGTPVGLPIPASGDDFQNHTSLDLPQPETRVLADILSRHTETPDECWFGVWEGFSDLHRAPSPLRRGFTRQRPGPGILPTEVAKHGTVGEQGRQYYLLNGALSELDEARAALNLRTPNLWWPADRSWFVATEIDFCWTLIGGSHALIDELTNSDRLEVFASGYDHRGMVDSDTINAD